MSTTKTNTQAQAKMEQVVAIWKKKSKNGTAFFSGHIGADKADKCVGFFNTKKKNPKEPDLRIYRTDKDGKAEKEEYISLWCNVSKKGTKYLTGKLAGTSVVGFINNKEDSKAPYVSVYYREDRPKEEAAVQETIKYEEVGANEELPF